MYVYIYRFYFKEGKSGHSFFMSGGPDNFSSSAKKIVQSAKIIGCFAPHLQKILIATLVPEGPLIKNQILGMVWFSFIFNYYVVLHIYKYIPTLYMYITGQQTW